MKKVAQSQARPAPARNFDIDVGSVEVIYAEDEEVFRETAVRELLKAGFLRENIHESENGIGALEDLARLQVEGDATLPLVVLLDVRMPGMDGRECALQIQELVKKRALRREPFVMCISSIARQVIVDEGKGNFQVVLPKPFNTSIVHEALDLLRRWWTLGLGRQLPAWKRFDPGLLDIITADVEPVCRLSATTAFTQAGVEDDRVSEVDNVEELLEALTTAQAGDRSRPLVVLLGCAPWAPRIRSLMESVPAATRRDPFVMCTSVDSDRICASPAVQHFHAFLPRSFGQADVRWCIELCRLWWLTRGDGPQDEDSGASEAESEESLSSAASPAG